MREVRLDVEFWEMKAPFKITGHTFTGANILHARLEENGVCGSGEATGVYYLGESGASMLRQAETVKAELERGLGREELRKLLPSGGARNAIDCALFV